MPRKEAEPVKLGTVARLCSGATAGAVGKSSVAPFQRIQIMYQVDPGNKLTLAKGMETTRQVLRNDGFLGLWRGNVANAGRSAPTAAVKFWSQSTYNQFLRDLNVLSKSSCQAVSGAMAGVTTVTVTYPLDLFRTKMAANSAFKGYADCARQTFAQSHLKGFYHGLSAPLVGSIPHTGVAFWAFYEIKKLMGIDENTKAAAPIRRTVAGFCAGFAGQTITYPFSTVRRRMQTSVEWQGKGLINCFVDTIRNEGVKGLFRAYSIHAFKGPVSAAISFMVNDLIKHYLIQWKTPQEEWEEEEEVLVASTTPLPEGGALHHHSQEQAGTDRGNHSI